MWWRLRSFSLLRFFASQRQVPAIRLLQCGVEAQTESGALARSRPLFGHFLKPLNEPQLLDHSPAAQTDFGACILQPVGSPCLTAYRGQKVWIYFRDQPRYAKV